MADKQFHLEIITPDRKFFDEDATMVELNTVEGEIGVYANHIPMTEIIAPGVLKIEQGSEKKEASLMSGFMEITPEKVTILAEIAEWPDEIDVERAKRAKERAQQRLNSGRESNINELRAEMALKRALIRLSIAGDK